MIQKLRQRSGSDSGFTLVELLVVMLILGLLAAIAIPSFFNQRDKAVDADAKEAVRTAQTSIETYATDNQGSYAGATAADLVADRKSDILSIPASETAARAMRRLLVAGQGRLVVLNGKRVVGIITRHDILQFIKIHTELES